MKHVDEWNSAEIEAVQAALERGRDATCINNLMFQPDSWQAITHEVFGGGSRAMLVDGFLVVYDVGRGPYSFKPMLFEYLIITVHPGGDLRNAISALVDVAKQEGCYAVAAGNSSGRHGLTRLYQRAGFRVVGESMLKEI